MKREKKAGRSVREWMMEYAYLVTMGAVIAVIAAGAMYTRQIRRESGMQAAADAPEIRQSATPTATTKARMTPLPTIAPIRVNYEALEAKQGTVRPVDGGIVRAYDKQNPVFWEALACVQVHEGIDIAEAAGAAVRCAMDGVVTGVTRDDLWGWRVRVAHMDGSEAVYAGLESCDVIESQLVARGRQLGVLMSEIPCERELGTHLHMELWKDGKSCDPAAILPRRDMEVAGI